MFSNKPKWFDRFNKMSEEEQSQWINDLDPKGKEAVISQLRTFEKDLRDEKEKLSTADHKKLGEIDPRMQKKISVGGLINTVVWMIKLIKKHGPVVIFGAVVLYILFS